MDLSRRAVLGGGAALGAVALTGTGAASAAAHPWGRPDKRGGPLGPLIPQGDLALPEGFSYRVIGTIGVDPLLDRPGGRVVGTTPSNLDGAGAFRHRNGVRLVRNHECRATAQVPVPLVRGTVYDDGVPSGMGGNTVVEVTSRGSLVEQWVALSGTIRNCAGGQTPWGSWLACEEDTTRAGTTVTVGGTAYTLRKDHGYTFEVFPAGPSAQIPEPITAWGRAVWEGAAIGPQRRDVYLTEDTGDGLFYRWTAPRRRVISRGIARQFGPTDGILQAAQVRRRGRPLGHYAELTKADLGASFEVVWIDGGEDRQAQQTDLRRQYPGATVHPKIEGCWSDGKGLYFTCSYASASEQAKYPAITQNQGMVFYYDYAAQRLRLVEYYELGHRFDGPDNIVVTPFGGVVIAEDGNDESHLISWTPGRGSQALALNLLNDSEWAGPVFSPDGRILFASIQSDRTYAILGPFRERLGQVTRQPSRSLPPGSADRPGAHAEAAGTCPRPRSCPAWWGCPGVAARWGCRSVARRVLRAGRPAGRRGRPALALRRVSRALRAGLPAAVPAAAAPRPEEERGGDRGDGDPASAVVVVRQQRAAGDDEQHDRGGATVPDGPLEVDRAPVVRQDQPGDEIGGGADTEQRQPDHGETHDGRAHAERLGDAGADAAEDAAGPAHHGAAVQGSEAAVQAGLRGGGGSVGSCGRRHDSSLLRPGTRRDWVQPRADPDRTLIALRRGIPVDRRR